MSKPSTDPWPWCAVFAGVGGERCRTLVLSFICDESLALPSLRANFERLALEV